MSTFNSEIGGRAELELGAVVPDWDSTSIMGVRNNITSEEDDSPSPPLSTTGNPKEWSFPGGLWEHRERCHLFRLGRDSGTSDEKETSVFGAGNSMVGLLSCVDAGGSSMIAKSSTIQILKPKRCLGCIFILVHVTNRKISMQCQACGGELTKKD